MKSKLFIFLVLLLACGPNEEEQYRQKLIGEINTGLPEAKAKLSTIESLTNQAPGVASGEIPQGLTVYASNDTKAGRWRGSLKNTIMLCNTLGALDDFLSHRPQAESFVQTIKSNLSKSASESTSKMELIDMASDVKAMQALRYIVLVKITNEVRPQVISPTQYTVGNFETMVGVYDLTTKQWIKNFPFNISSNEEMKYNFGGYNQDYKGDDQLKMQRQVIADLVIKFESELVKVLQK